MTEYYCSELLIIYKNINYQYDICPDIRRRVERLISYKWNTNKTAIF